MFKELARLKRTALYSEHLKLKAKMVEFGGWEMPVSYSGIIQEHQAVRNKLGIFDIGHMGILQITNSQLLITNSAPLLFIQKLTTNDASKLEVNQCQYSLLCNEKGGVIDDILVYRLADSYRLVVNASNTDKVMAWLKKNLTQEVELKDLKESLTLISAQGPASAAMLSPYFSKKLSLIKKNRCIEGLLFEKKVLLSRTGYTGEDGFEIFCEIADAPLIWQKLLELGAIPCGLGARDTLRLEAALPLYGHEYNEQTSPLDAGYAWAVKFNKENFVGKKELEKGAHKKLVGLILNDRRIPRQGFKVFAGTNGDTKEIGEVTSGTLSPRLNAPVALAYIHENVSQNQPLWVEIRGEKAPAKIIGLPFYHQRSL